MKKKLGKLKLGNFESNSLDFKSQENIKGGKITTGTGTSHTSEVKSANTGEATTENIKITEYEF